MNKKIQTIREEVRNLIEERTKHLGDIVYIEVLEEIEADVHGMIDCKKDEIAG